MNLYLQIQYQANLDLFTFYESKFSVKCPEDSWFQSICASLRMKHSVLIIEEKSFPFPSWDGSKRWVATDNYCWLSPRSLSVILAAYRKSPMNFQEFMFFLKSSK